MTVGLLLPLSNAHVGMSKDFVDGFNSLLKLKERTGAVTIKKKVWAWAALKKKYMPRPKNY